MLFILKEPWLRIAQFFLFLPFVTISILSAIIITGPQGDSLIYSYTELAKIPRETFTTTRVKSGEIQEDIWTGFRFNHWFNDNIKIPYKIIRFESADNYMVSLSKAEFDSLECWLAFTQNGQVLPENGIRLIFPQLRDMKWIRGLNRVVLEDFSPLKLPARFEFLDKRLKQETLIENPPPFSDTKGYYFADLLPLSARNDTHSVVLYSSDGIKCSLEYPRHLKDGIIEPFLFYSMLSVFHNPCGRFDFICEKINKNFNREIYSLPIFSSEQELEIILNENKKIFNFNIVIVI